MLNPTLPTNHALRDQSRFRLLGLTPSLSAVEFALLVLLGVSAALATALLDFNLRLPGHAILRTIGPLALGLALVPRFGSGVLMSGAAVLTSLALTGMGRDAGGVGALTSLCATGPILDVAARWSRHGWRLYVSLACGALASNLLAFAVRGAVKLAGADHAGGRAVHAWWQTAIVSYTVCGLLAGLLSAAMCFHYRSKLPHVGQSESLSEKGVRPPTARSSTDRQTLLEGV